MADTSHTPASVAPVEGDGVSYSGIVWFVVILTATTLVCQVLMFVLLKTMQSQNPAPAAERAGLTGRVYPEMVTIGTPNGPTPQLLAREPVNLEMFREQEHKILTTYGVIDQNAGTYRIPVDRAKELVLEHHMLAVRGQAPATDAKAGKTDGKTEGKPEVKKTEGKN